VTQIINIDATHTKRVAVSILVYPCIDVSVLAVLAERPWFQGHHGDTVVCWMQFLAGVHNTRKVILFTIAVQTDRYFWSHFSRFATVCTSSLTLRNSKSRETQHVTMAVIFQRAVRDEYMTNSSD
jgi:hypothetical protein